MVVISVDGCRPQRSGQDGQPIGPFFDGRPEPPQFTSQVGDAVGFFVANVGDVADGGRPLGKQCHRSQGHHSVADGVHVDVDAP